MFRCRKTAAGKSSDGSLPRGWSAGGTEEVTTTPSSLFGVGQLGRLIRVKPKDRGFKSLHRDARGFRYTFQRLAAGYTYGRVRRRSTA